MKTVLPAVLLALAALTTTLASSPAQAGADATSRIDNLTLGVLDLTPDDGAAASFTIDAFASRLLVYSNTINSGGSYTQTSVWPAPGTVGQAQLPANAPPGTALAGTTGAIGNATAHAAADTALGVDNYLGAESQQQLWLTLAPHTVLTVDGDLFTQARRTLTAGEGYWVFSWVAVDLTDLEQTTTSMLTRESTLNGDPASTLAERQEHFMLAYANPGDTELVVSLNLLAYTDVAVYAAGPGGVTPVPEPATSAMLLAGLLLTGTIARHRQLQGQVRHSDTTSSFNSCAGV